MGRQLRIYDIPDEHPSVIKWLDELANDEFLAHILMVEAVGAAFAGCLLLPNDMWALKLPVGHGQTANLIFFSVKGGDYLAVHGFTLKPGEDEGPHLEIAYKRKRDLIG